MAVRRPRIKATALLTTKRKPRDSKTENLVKEAISTNDDVKQFLDEVSAPLAEAEEKRTTEPVECIYLEDDIKSSKEDYEAKPSNEENIIGNVLMCPSISEKSLVSTDGKLTNIDNSFKCPASIEHTRSTGQNTLNIGVDDVFYADMEEAILQSHMQKNNAETPTSTSSKQQSRQRMRPVPMLQRRNSLIGAPTSTNCQNVESSSMPSDNQLQQPSPPTEKETDEVPTLQQLPSITHRRERHYSASMVQSSPTPNISNTMGQHHHTPHKFTPTMGLGRIRTESNCSAFSDSFLAPSAKARKTDEHNHSNNRSNQRRDFASRVVNGNLDKSTLKMFDLIYYNPVTNPMEKRTAATVTSEAAKKDTTTDENDLRDIKVTPTDAKVDSINGTRNAMPVPQLKLNANGDLILDEKTLEIETTAEQEARKVLANSSLIFLDENTGMNGFYKRQKRTKEWTSEDTIKFYRCLQTVGTDFSLMCQLFPKRTRRDLKLKFKKEERSNLALINKALLYPRLLNIDDLKKQLETEEREREDTIKRWKEIHQKEPKTIKRRKINESAAARVLKQGEDIYENENIVKRKLKRRINKTAVEKTTDNTQMGKPSEKTPTTAYVAESLNQMKIQKKESGPIIPTNSATSHPHFKTTPPSKHTPTTTPVKYEVMHIADYTVKTEQHNNLMISQCNPNENGGEAAENQLPEAEAEGDYVNYILPHIHTEIPTEEEEMLETCDNGVFAPNKHDDDNDNDFKTYVDLDDGTVVNTFDYDDVDDDDDNDDDNYATDKVGGDKTAINKFDYDDDDNYETDKVGDLAMIEEIPATPSSSAGQHELDECDIQQILRDLAAGSLVLVSTLDPDDSDNVINEIYMIDKTTGDLCDEPLDIPDYIVQGVLSVMS